MLLAKLNGNTPKITSEGTIFVFDNLGSNPINGLSRIVSIDIKTKNIIGIYESSDFNDFLNQVWRQITI